MTSQENARVVIVGGGFGGLETALYLRERLGDGADVVLVSDRAHFTFRPYLTYIPFGMMPEEITFPLEQVTRPRGITFHQSLAHSLDPAARVIRAGETPLTYDFLVVATGALMAQEAIPGMQEHAYTIWLQQDMERLQAAFERLVSDVRAGHDRRVVCFVPPGCRWAGPLYEMAFMLATWLRWKKVRDRVTLVFVTWEPTYLQVLGRHLHPVIEEEFVRKHIEGHTGRAVRRVDADAVIDDAGERWPYDLLIAAPSYAASFIWDGLPVDAHGFLRTEAGTRQVKGHPDIYAVGDATDYPVKQAFLALLQADAAAEHVAARLLRVEPAFAFDPASIWTMDQLDQTVVARVALPGQDAAERGEDQERRAEVQRLPLGLLHRMTATLDLPPQFADNPLYAGLFWKGTTVGLNMLSHLLKP